VGSVPLLVVRGHVDVAALERANPGAPLLGALVWTGLPAVNPICLRFDLPELRAACPDPYGVFLGQLARIAPVAADGSFALEIDELPQPLFSVGDAVTRITYGSVLVFEDGNGDGRLSLVVPREGPKAGPGGELGPDVTVAASFHSLQAPQERVVLREGGFVQSSHFYPAPGCPAPPPGFSLLRAPPYADAQPPDGSCQVREIGATVEVPPLAPQAASALACRRLRLGPWQVVRVRAGGPILPEVGTRVCLSPELLAVIFPGACPELVVLALKGCEEDAFCPQPAWDETAAAPAWWPCR
jgi:hypothetical protein